MNKTSLKLAAVQFAATIALTSVSLVALYVVADYATRGVVA